MFDLTHSTLLLTTLVGDVPTKLKSGLIVSDSEGSGGVGGECLRCDIELIILIISLLQAGPGNKT